ncbi:Utrophin [Chelonia mydas]|uniref:Utrophin n=1 Tax=Chelonia mydas TaxID=8469 RepID=M7BMH7_CHEMY|nr:Utrophin [Chelonia mydas]
MVKALGNSEEAALLQHRLDDMNQRWNDLKAKSAGIRAHLEASAEKWNRLLTSLEELITWLNVKDEELKKQMPIGGDVSTLQQQYDHCKIGAAKLTDPPSHIQQSSEVRELGTPAGARGFSPARPCYRALLAGLPKVSLQQLQISPKSYSSLLFALPYSHVLPLFPSLASSVEVVDLKSSFNAIDQTGRLLKGSNSQCKQRSAQLTLSS